MRTVNYESRKAPESVRRGRVGDVCLGRLGTGFGLDTRSQARDENSPGYDPPNNTGTVIRTSAFWVTPCPGTVNSSDHPVRVNELPDTVAVNTLEPTSKTWLTDAAVYWPPAEACTAEVLSTIPVKVMLPALLVADGPK